MSFFDDVKRVVYTEVVSTEQKIKTLEGLLKAYESQSPLLGVAICSACAFAIGVAVGLWIL